MRKFNVESKPGFAVPRYPSAMPLYVQRTTGTQAAVGLVIAATLILGLNLYRAYDARPVHGTAECERQQANYRTWEDKNGLPHSFEAEVELCRSEHG